jgi:imidazolonepropionase-like amidohydrolase
VRDIVDGTWQDPVGESDLVLGDDLWALPGLVDGHAHLAGATMDFSPGDPAGARERATRAVNRGVLLLLDKGWGDVTAIDLIDRVPASQRPEIEAAGVMLAVDGGYIEGFPRIVAPGEVELTVAKAAVEGRGWVKMIGDWPRKGVGPMANFSESELKKAVAVAAANGAQVAVHTMAREVPSMAVRAGVHSIDHGLFLDAGDLDLLGSRGGIWVPTILRMEAVIRQLGETSSGGRLIKEGLANVSRLLPLAAEAGVRILAGTDMAVSIHEVAREALRMGEMGLSNRQVVAAVSTWGYAGTGRSGEFAVGSVADAVLFPVNPVEDLGVLAHPATVIRMGVVVR